MDTASSESETFYLSGALQKANDEKITESEMDEFMDRFIELVEAKGFLFGGGFKLDPDSTENFCREELKDAMLSLSNAIHCLENDCEITVAWKEEADQLLSKMKATLESLNISH